MTHLAVMYLLILAYGLFCFLLGVWQKEREK